MNRRHLPLALVATCIASACTVTLPAAQAPLTSTQPVFVSSGPAGRNPIIQSFTANPTNVTKGQPITFQVVAHAPNNETLQFNWSATGGMLSATTGQSLMWTPPDKPGVYTVTVIISNGRGGIVTGSQNLTVQADGAAAIGGASASPSIAPPSIAPSATPNASPSVMTSASPTAQPTTPSPLETPSFRKLEDFTKSDFHYKGDADKSGSLTFHATSASLPIDQYGYELSLVHDDAASIGSLGPMDVSGTKTYTGWPTGVYVLNFYKKQSPSYSASCQVNVNPEIGTVYFFLNDHPLPMPRANWKVPDGMSLNLPPYMSSPDPNPKVQDGAVYLFKYDGNDLDLGTFELP